MRFSRQRPGYVFLVSVLAVGAVVTLIVAVLLLLSSTIARSTISLEQSSRAIALADACIERTLSQLYADPGYTGDLTVNYTDGSCTVQTISGYGTYDRTVCVQGTSGSVTRQFEIAIASLYPSILIRSWVEVASLTACSP